MARIKKNKAIKRKSIFEWIQGILSIVGIGGIVSVALFFNNRHHSMEMIELNQKHHLELQRQHDEF